MLEVQVDFFYSIQIASFIRKKRRINDFTLGLPAAKSTVVSLEVGEGHVVYHRLEVREGHEVCQLRS